MATTNKAKLPVGFVIAGKYRITGELGRGGMAAVYEAENVDIGKRVAIKILAQELISSTVVVERFLREARAVAAIRSPYICDVYDSGKLEDGRPFLVLELLEGESLYEQMIRVGQIDGPTTVTIINQTCKGLVKAHSANIVHRDLKPENIFVTKDEEGRILAKILDFGLAKFYSSMETGNAGQARLTREGAVFGTPAYMSPEQVRGQGAVDSRADLWALACITYESLTGRTVWNTEQGVAMTFAQIANAPLPDAYALRPDLPEGFRAWFTRALDRNIDKRFQTPKEFSDELLRAMSMSQMSSTSFDHEEDPPMSGRSQAQLQTLDAPFESNPALAARTSRAKFAAPGALPSAPTVERPTAGDPAQLAGPAKSSGAGRVIAAIAILGAVGAAAYGGYRALVPATSPTSVTSSQLLDGGVPIASGSGSSDTPQPVASAPYLRSTFPWVPQLSKAQDEIAAGDLNAAEKTLKEASTSKSPLVATMLGHVQKAMGSSKCALTGLGRPRSYDLLDDRVAPRNATQVVVAQGPQGPVVAWTEIVDAKQQAFVVALDASLRPRTEPINVTSEGKAVLEIDLRPVGDQFLLTYWESQAADLAIYARYLKADGTLGSKARLIANQSAAVKVFPFPQVLSIPGKGIAIAYVANIERTDELFVQFVNDDLSKKGDPIRVTALRPSRGGKSRVATFSTAVTKDAVHFFVRVERDADRPLAHVRIPVADAWQSVDTKDLNPSSPDTSIGTFTLVTKERARAGEIAGACGQPGCYVLWGNDQQDGISGAFFDNGEKESLWTTTVTNRGRHPAIATNDQGAQVAWFEQGKVMTAHLERDPRATLETSTIAAISPNASTNTNVTMIPSIAPGSKPNEWFVSWLDQEAPAGARGEVYVARTECK